MYSPGIPWHVLDVSTLAQPSQSLSHWLCALQPQDSPAGGWAQGRLRSAGGQVLPPELRKGHSMKPNQNQTKTRAERVADKSRTGKGGVWQRFVPRVLCSPCRQRLPTAFPSCCLLCVCPESSVRVLGRGMLGQGLLLHPASTLSVMPVPGSLGTVKFSSTRMGWVGRATLQSGLLGNIPPWRNGTPTFST